MRYPRGRSRGSTSGGGGGGGSVSGPLAAAETRDFAAIAGWNGSSVGSLAWVERADSLFISDGSSTGAFALAERGDYLTAADVVAVSWHKLPTSFSMAEGSTLSLSIYVNNPGAVPLATNPYTVVSGTLPFGVRLDRRDGTLYAANPATLGTISGVTFGVTF